MTVKRDFQRQINKSKQTECQNNGNCQEEKAKPRKIYIKISEFCYKRQGVV